MDTVEVELHHAAGRAYGQEATCGHKVDYRSEGTASASAARMSAKYGRELEAYPCVWCGGWHIGRAMTEAERAQFG